MPYFIGTDEAGYGPNLGPLVISATVWEVESLDDWDLYARLAKVVDSSNCGRQSSKLHIGDSKALYKPGKGLGRLERGIFTCLAAIEKYPRTWRSIWSTLSADHDDRVGSLPWYRDFDDSLPVDLDANEARTLGQSLARHGRRAGCVPCHIESRAVFPDQFNSLVDRHGNKASALSQVTLGLVKSVMQRLPDDDPIYVLCDKHGGRNRYGPLLNETFPETLAVIRAEGRSESSYVLGSAERRREFVFRAKGESFLPSALASMVSKYLRELAMRAFNCYWTARVKDLRPTAGYPLDAKRFKLEIAQTQQQLGIDDRILWRCR